MIELAIQDPVDIELYLSHHSILSTNFSWSMTYYLRINSPSIAMEVIENKNDFLLDLEKEWK